MNRLENLERAEELVIEILESAGNAINELKEIQANDPDKNSSFMQNSTNYYEKLSQIKQILMQELSSLNPKQSTTIRRPGVDKLAISEWGATVIADNLHELLESE